MDHRPEQAAQLGQPVRTQVRGVPVEQPRHRGLLLGELVGADPADSDRHTGGHRLGLGVRVHLVDEILGGEHAGMDLLGQGRQQRILQYGTLALFQQYALVLHVLRDLAGEGGSGYPPSPALRAFSNSRYALHVRSTALLRTPSVTARPPRVAAVNASRIAATPLGSTALIASRGSGGPSSLARRSTSAAVACSAAGH